MTVKTIGIMTGNSLDAVDVVMTSFDKSMIKDEAFFSLPYPQKLREDFLLLKECFKQDENHLKVYQSDLFKNTVDDYTKLTAQAVNGMLEKFAIDRNSVAAIGFHGQTCDHFPPSVAGSQKPYTLQVGDAQKLADLTDIPVIYDFRSDDLMNGGEGAPLAPLHNLHLARALGQNISQAVAFCNGGNTGNIAVVLPNERVVGWDIGPFNHLPDLLMREYQNMPCDINGEYGKKGNINLELLRKLFENAAKNVNGENYYLSIPPKSSDPHWYSKVYDDKLSFFDNLRTAEYLASYSFVYNFKYLPDIFMLPNIYVLFGGGWKNPIVSDDFVRLINAKAPILPEHRAVFDEIYKRMPENAIIDFADKFGFSGEYTEARIFADMAYSKIVNAPFSYPDITGCRKPTVDGVFALPQTGKEYLLQALLKKYDNPSVAETAPKLWSRAAKMW